MSLKLEYDSANMYNILLNFPAQIREAIEIGKRIDVNTRDGFRNIVYCGMGGSAISGDFVKNLLRDKIEVPFEVVRSYNLPGYVNDRTLVILVSYSGNTEETLSCFYDAIKRGAYIACISSNGKIEKEFHALNDKGKALSFVKIPSGYPPRTAFGYLFVTLLYLLIKLGYAEKNLLDDLNVGLEHLEECSERFSVENSPNYAYELALSLMNRLPVIYGSAGGTDVIARRWTTQFSENSKILAYYNALPEMNHNEIVGWENLDSVLKNINVVFLKDEDDNPRVKLRQNITKSLLIKDNEPLPNKIVEVVSKGANKLDRWLYLVYLGDFVSWYLAILYDTDPTPVEKIDMLKKSLAKEN